MRKTLLKRASVSVAAFTLCVAILAAILRVITVGADSTDAKDGAALFEEKGCSQCHYTDSVDTKIGPGLKNLFQREKLPVSASPVTEENVRQQLTTPYENMPSYADRLIEEERDRLIHYLKSL